MSTMTLHPFGSGPLRNRAIAPRTAGPQPSLWQRFSRLYWDGLQLHVRELDLGAAAPSPASGATDVATPARAATPEDQPVVRVWRGRVRSADADAFHRYLQTIGAPSYRAARGNRGVWLMRRPLGEVTEYLLVTHWETEADVAAYAGGDAAQPLHFAETERYLLPDGEGVEHFALLPEAAPRYASVRI